MQKIKGVTIVLAVKRFAVHRRMVSTREIARVVNNRSAMDSAVLQIRHVKETATMQTGQRALASRKGRVVANAKTFALVLKAPARSSLHNVAGRCITMARA